MSKEPFEVLHYAVPPYCEVVNHYAHFDCKADAEEWSKANPHDGQRVSQAPRGDWVVMWSTKE